MKLLLTIVLVVAAIYAGVWVVAARGLDRGLQAALDAAAAQGWQIETSSLETSGFPSRFDVTAQDLSVTTPDRSTTWQTPWLQSAALSYRPNRVIVTLPSDQQVTTAGQTLAISSDGLRASFGVAADTRLSFDALTAEAQRLTVTSDLGWSLAAGPSLLALRPLGPAANTYEGYVDLTELQLDVPLPSSPETTARLTADTTVTLDRPLDRMTFQTAAPAVTAVTLNSLDLTWGPVQLTGQGAVDVDAAGVPSGEVVLSIAGWRDAVTLMTEAGWIAPDQQPTLVRMASLMAGGSGDTLRLPLTLANGGMALGPVPLGPAPRLILR